MFKKHDEPVVGVPYFVGVNPYQASVIYGDPKGIPIHQTMYRDTPAPFNCPYCGNSGLTIVRSKASLAAYVACMMPFMLGICFLCPSMDCLWHKYHYCPACTEKLLILRKQIHVQWWICHNGCKRVLLCLHDKSLLKSF